MFERISYFEEVIDSVITVRKRSFPHSGCPRFCITDLHLYPGIYPYLYHDLVHAFLGAYMCSYENISVLVCVRSYM